MSESNMPRKAYSNISIPEDLKEAIERLFEDLEEKDRGLGYSSVTEFIKEAVRVHLDRIREREL